VPKDWRRVRQDRPDLTDYVIHWTRGRTIASGYSPPFEVLKEIVGCGYLKPSHAPKHRQTVGGTENTIKGPHPAVCFTEQPLDAFVKFCKVLSSRYNPYGVALHKWHLFQYGGRPVIYGDENLLRSLPDDHKYLWVRYNPVPSTALGGYPVDRTHEREWRARQHAYHYLDLGLGPTEGVPLLLPPVSYPGCEKLVLSLPRLLVRTTAEADELREWIRNVPPYNGANDVLKYYFGTILPIVMIIPLEEVEQRLPDDIRYARLDTLPCKEMDPSFELPTPESYL
jgi:hypothetical protein